MKQIFVLLISTMASIANAQTISKPGSQTYYLAGRTEALANKTGSPYGILQLFYWGNNKAYFKLKYVSGNASKNMGIADDTISIINNQAIYHSKEDSSCKLIFRFDANEVIVQQVSKPGAFSCGFGRNVYVDGNYSKAPVGTGLKIAPGKHALSLQWIGFDQPGNVLITDLGNGLYQIEGQQKAKVGNDYLKINGHLQLASERELIFNGTIENKVSFNNKGIPCVKKGVFNFKAAIGKKYWRLQQMKNCSGDMTVDYIDLFF